MCVFLTRETLFCFFSNLQFQEQLGQGCSPEESDTFQSEGTMPTNRRGIILASLNSVYFMCFFFYPPRIRDS